ncbi:matrixin family metalloprotease [Hamadaea tsunoensis]|uniref:matrixin family metalloprotease n=1 Tax=Hamadaea tsunoensis TaxID=53368 RepID=UPI000480FC6D|nr:matrixin family metalloprotease [Hamadaea tsunoensis]
MRRRLLTVVTSLLIALPLAAVVNAPSASAWNSLGCKWSTSSINFYVPSPLISYPAWGNAVPLWNGLDAHFNWNTTPALFTGTNENRGNTVSWSGVTRKPGTVQDFPTCSGGFWVSGGMEVVLNWPIVSGYSTAKRYGVAAHELGHSFGLAHNNGSTAYLMYYSDSRTVNTPQSDDKAGVNGLY